jgi:hypothetical protein
MQLAYKSRWCWLRQERWLAASGRSDEATMLREAEALQTLISLPIFEPANPWATASHPGSSSGGTPHAFHQTPATSVNEPPLSPDAAALPRSPTQPPDGADAAPSTENPDSLLQFVDLAPERFLAPDGARPELLTSQFVAPGSSSEARLLSAFLGVRRLGTIDFYR